MIKNDNQLKKARSRLDAIQQELEEYKGQFSGIELQLYITPLCFEEAELRRDIEEYLELHQLLFQDAINGPLNRPHLLDNVGELLAKLRIAAKMTQSELAELIGWDQSNLSRFESDKYSSQTIAKVVEYVSALGVWLHVTPSLTEKPHQAPVFVEKRSTQRRGFAPTGTSYVPLGEYDALYSETDQGTIPWDQPITLTTLEVDSSSTAAR